MSGDLSGTREVKEAGRCLRTIMLVDRSLGPKSNNRSAKLGTGNQTFASAVNGFDARDKRVTTGDGTGSALTRYPFEPDNWIFRKHGKGFDNVWALRLTVDKTNKAKDKKNRSTHVVDQSEDQNFGTLADLFWICKTGVDGDYAINGAGFPTAGGSRDALALSMAKNEGFISDGKAFGQLAHVLCFIDPDNSVPTGDKKKPKDVPTGGGGGGVPTVGNTNGFGNLNRDVASVDGINGQTNGFDRNQPPEQGGGINGDRNGFDNQVVNPVTGSGVGATFTPQKQDE